MADHLIVKQLSQIKTGVCFELSMKKGLLFASAAFFFLLAKAQYNGVRDTMMPGTEKESKTIDTTSLLYAFKKGQVNGYLRYFFMATDNAKGLSDYYANAVGGGIKYETSAYKGFQFGVSGFFVYNIGSSDLSVPDQKTNQFNRYEIALFDITDAGNKNNINRLEELYLKYSWKNSHVTFGKQLLNTPFINLQDGRMRPTATEGFWAEINDIKNTKIETGFLYHISPRSTVAWYKIGESFGIYSTGVNMDGTKSGYAGNIKSPGIWLLGITHTFQENISLKVWNVFVPDVFNTSMLQADYNYPLKNQSKLVAGAQYIFQHAIKDGGNEDPAKTYFQKNGKAQTFGARIGWEDKRWETSINYNRITNDGRYLMPREWGRDPFYTFLPRERNDGFGDVNAYAIKAGYNIPTANLKVYTGFGYYDLPEVTNYALNKYGMPSYKQVNIELRYEFKGFLQGMDLQLLYAYKAGCGNTFNDDKYVINRVNMSNWNLVLNYHF